MAKTGTLEVTTPSDREIRMTRTFEAPRQLVFDAHTRPELMKRWLYGPDGWSLAVCEVDLRVGGKLRYVWRRDRDGQEMDMGGVIREVVAPERLVSTERFDESWYPGEAVNTIVLTETGGLTLLTYTLLYESKDARDTALRSGMETGMVAGFDRLEGILASLAIVERRDY